MGSDVSCIIWSLDDTRVITSAKQALAPEATPAQRTASPDTNLLQVIPPVAAEGLDRRGPGGGVPAVSWPWVPACGSLEPPRRDGESAQKTGENREKMGEI